jgi:hypothetical protein
MTPPIAAAIAAPVQTAVTQPQMLQPTGVSPAGDLERLRALVASSAPPAGYVEAAPTPPPTVAVEQSAFRTLGDSILESISSFNSGYNQSLESINTKLDSISSTNTLDLGSNFDEIMGLQVEIARWSMSVMGVDNASKAGTNTVKELSKGG